MLGTDTDVGKTVTSALLLRALARRAKRVAYWKPVQAGSPGDLETVAGLVDELPIRFASPTYDLALPASPHEAAAAEGVKISLDRLDADLEQLISDGELEQLVIECAGGVLVPYTLAAMQVDWIVRWRERAAFVLVARTALGTLNHTLLSLEALRHRDIEPSLLLLVGPEHRSNLETLRNLSGVQQLLHVPHFDPLGATALEQWLDRSCLESLLAGDCRR